MGCLLLRGIWREKGGNDEENERSHFGMGLKVEERSMGREGKRELREVKI